MKVKDICRLSERELSTYVEGIHTRSSSREIKMTRKTLLRVLGSTGCAMMKTFGSSGGLRCHWCDGPVSGCSVVVNHQATMSSPIMYHGQHNTGYEDWGEETKKQRDKKMGL
jgi:hypothetical protein